MKAKQWMGGEEGAGGGEGGAWSLASTSRSATVCVEMCVGGTS